MALLMMAVLHFSLVEVFRLTYPQFEYIGLNLERLQYQAALNQVFFGVAAAIGGKDQRENLYASAGDLFKLREDAAPNMSFTPEDLAAARETMKKIQAQREVKENV